MAFAGVNAEEQRHCSLKNERKLYIGSSKLYREGDSPGAFEPCKAFLPPAKKHTPTYPTLLLDATYFGETGFTSDTRKEMGH